LPLLPASGPGAVRESCRLFPRLSFEKKVRRRPPCPEDGPTPFPRVRLPLFSPLLINADVMWFIVSVAGDDAFFPEWLLGVPVLIESEFGSLREVPRFFYQKLVPRGCLLRPIPIRNLPEQRTRSLFLLWMARPHSLLRGLPPFPLRTLSVTKRGSQSTPFPFRKRRILPFSLC